MRAASVIDAAAAVLVALASIEAFVRSLQTYFVLPAGSRIGSLRPIRWRLGHWFVLALELLIGSDIIRSAVNPTWVDLAQLAAIVVLRAVINFTLEHDMKAALTVEAPAKGDGGAPPAAP